MNLHLVHGPSGPDPLRQEAEFGVKATTRGVATYWSTDARWSVRADHLKWVTRRVAERLARFVQREGAYASIFKRE